MTIYRTYRIRFLAGAKSHSWLPLVFPMCVLSIAYALLALTLTESLSHNEIMQRCVLVDPRRARIWSVGNVEIGLAYFGVFGGMLYYFFRVYSQNRQHLLDLASAGAYLVGSFALNFICVRYLEPFAALLIGDAIVMTFTLLVSRQVWFRRLLGIFVPIIFLTCGVGHFLEGLSFWHSTYLFNTPWTMVTADIGFAVLVNASRFPAFIRGEDVVAELTASKTRADALQAQVDDSVRQLREHARALESQRDQLALANTKLEILARTDALTGIRNRLAFQEQLEHEVGDARREGTLLALLIFDVDRFKEYNDAFGHPAGDVVLASVARILQDGAGESLVSRIGGEEFALIVPRTSRDEVAMAAERLRCAIEDYPWSKRNVTVSVGGTVILFGAFVPDDLLPRADAALYQSKTLGRNRSTIL